jgi:hypothetical protein
VRRFVEINLLNADNSKVEQKLDELIYLVKAIMFAEGIPFDWTLEDIDEDIEEGVILYSNEENEIIDQHIRKSGRIPKERT